MTESADPPRPQRNPRSRLALAVAAVVLGGFLVAVWASDRVTWQGQRVIYAVACSGNWIGNRCVGVVRPGARYVFQASHRRGEVTHWVIGSDAPSVTYRKCAVANRDNWTCSTTDQRFPSPVLEMRRGKLIGGPFDASSPLRTTKKWKWWIARIRSEMLR